MGEATLTVLTSVEAGLRIDNGESTAHTDGAKFLNTGREMIFIESDDGSVSPVLTITGQNTCPFGVIHNTTYTCTHTQTHVIGPFNINHFNDTSNYCHIGWGAIETDCKYVVVRLGAQVG